MGGYKRGLLAAEDARNHSAALGEAAAKGLGIVSRCHRCGHGMMIAAADLVERFGPSVPVPEVGAELPCDGCGTNDVATVPMQPVAVPG